MAQNNQNQRGEGNNAGQTRDESGRFTEESSNQSGGGQGRDSNQGGGDDGRGWHGDSEGHREAALKGGSQDRPRDEEGRFASEDEEGSRGE